MINHLNVELDNFWRMHGSAVHTQHQYLRSIGAMGLRASGVLRLQRMLPLKLSNVEFYIEDSLLSYSR